LQEERENTGASIHNYQLLALQRESSEPPRAALATGLISAKKLPNTANIEINVNKNQQLSVVYSLQLHKK